MRKRQTDEFALTDEEIAFLKSDRAHGAARRFTSRQHDTVGIRISAYQKVAAAADAEYRALVAIARLQLARENEALETTASEPTDTATRVVELTQENRAMRAMIEGLRNGHLLEIASDSLAVSSSD